MSITSSPRLRGFLAAGLLSTAVLTGCGGDDAEADAGAGSGSSSKAEEAIAKEDADPVVDLASGLLPAEAFGPDAVVASVSPEELQKGAGLAASFDDVEIMPDACNSAVQGTQPDLEDFEDIAAVSATQGTSAVVEMLVRGGPTRGTVEALAGAAERCPEAQVTSPDIGSATVRFQDLPVADLGDGAAALRYTTVVALPDGTELAVPALLGAVEDGDRLVVLTQLAVDPTGAATPELDDAAFTALLEQAYRAQSDALD
ncbi:hypothetical protein JKP75_12165 [Blastococcus sp. TML/M2B]|uniref:hypothetical protein n=1 Tax=unclassified Blastococcus TaxID=2619396 RepID=UPI001909E397|nr:MULTISPECIES: hypothetical protein [unclassified Blastococcus]MBN1093244.1 hypothetical protein [Blastococcus sp. TML/M2B]MBN1096644.1 hypothetical protein [Blastococcus sp. TML/C7B]